MCSYYSYEGLCSYLLPEESLKLKPGRKERGRGEGRENREAEMDGWTLPSPLSVQHVFFCLALILKHVAFSI